MPRPSVSAGVVVVAIGVLISPSLITSQGRRIGQLEVEDINNRPVAAREVLVKMRSPIPGAQAAQLAAGRRRRKCATGRPAWHSCASGRVRFPRPPSSRAFSNRPDVEYAEPNYVVTTFEEPNDPLFPQLWGLKNIGQSVNGGVAWNPRRRHQRDRGLGDRTRHTHRTSSPSSIPASTTTTPISPRTSGRPLRRSPSSSAASPSHARPARTGSTPSTRPAIRWTTTTTARTYPARSARSATTPSASPASTGCRRSWA